MTEPAEKGKLELVPVTRINDYQAELAQSLLGPSYRDITAYAVVSLRADGTSTSAYSPGTSGVARLLGAIELLRHRILRGIEDA